MPGIYIHIPFCRQACNYCDFYFSTSLDNKNAFINALLKEIELQQDYLSDSSTNAKEKIKISSLYFGGGTPSLLTVKEINKIYFKLLEFYDINENTEITLEANPDDLTIEYLKSLHDTQINRLSIGVQSFSDADLKYMNRVHTSAEAIDAIYLASDGAYNNVSIDLIYGTPTMTNETWIQNLEMAFYLEVDHLSCYSLTVEPRTALAALIKKGSTPAVDDQKSAEQFELLMQLSSEKGFDQYEISNYCRNEKYSIHNSSYWKGEKYLGLGPSAHSYNGVSRQWNISNNARYINSLHKGEVNFKKEDLTDSQKYNEYVLTTLRTKWGTSAQKIYDASGAEFESHFKKEAEPFLKQNLLIEEKNIYYLSAKGKLFADKIASDLFYIPEKIV